MLPFEIYLSETLFCQTFVFSATNEAGLLFSTDIMLFSALFCTDIDIQCPRINSVSFGGALKTRHLRFRAKSAESLSFSALCTKNQGL